MITYKLELNKNIVVNININKKPIKNFYLKVLKNCNISLDIPQNTNIETAYNFISDKKSWIKKHISKVATFNKNNITEKFKNAGNVYILGRKYKLHFYDFQINKIEVIDLNINIYSKRIKDVKYIYKQYLNYLKEHSSVYFQKILDKYFNVINKYHAQKPTVTIRKMKTKWGNCNADKNKIILNTSLFKTSVGCMEYVILHELTHLLYLRHNKFFYNFLELYLPNWKEYKKQLDTEFYRLI